MTMDNGMDVQDNAWAHLGRQLAAKDRIIRDLIDERDDHKACAENWEANARKWSDDWHELRDERDALAAHVAATTMIMNKFFLCDDYSANGEGDGTSDGILMPIHLVEELADLSSETPATSLARLKAKAKAEAFENLANYAGHWTQADMRAIASDYRRQAQGPTK